MNRVAATFAARGWRRAWVLDTEYKPVGGELQIPHCLCAPDIIGLERRDIWFTEGMPCPFAMAKDELFILYAADADILTFIAMGWPAPLNVIDPRLEWMRVDNGGDQYKPNSAQKKGYSLLDAARAFRVPAIPDATKDFWRKLAIRGGPFTAEEAAGLVRYCRWDVDLAVRVLLASWSVLGLDDPLIFNQALLRGRYMPAAARSYAAGIPINAPALKRLIRHAVSVRLGLIGEQSGIFPFYRPDGTFSEKLFARFLHEHGRLAYWPRTATGKPSKSEDTLEAMAEDWPLIGEYSRFRTFIDQLKAFDLPIGPDGRARTSLRPFATKTARNAPKAAEFIFAQNSIFRHLIQPPRGRALISVDWSAQELHIAARLSRDPKLLEIAAGGRDPYIELAIAVGLAPAGATEESNPEARGTGKIIQLALLYGAGPALIARATGMTLDQAKGFLKRQRETFRRFYAWSDAQALKAVTCKPLATPLGWTIRFRPGTSTQSPERTGRNIRVQGLAADMMKILMIRLTEAGIAACAAIHDGFLIECGAGEADAVLEQVKAAMDRCAIVLIGATIPIKHKIFRWPARFDEGKARATEMYETIMRLIDEAEAKQGAAAEGQLGDLQAATNI